VNKSFSSFFKYPKECEVRAEFEKFGEVAEVVFGCISNPSGSLDVFVTFAEEPAAVAANAAQSRYGNGVKIEKQGRLQSKFSIAREREREFLARSVDRGTTLMIKGIPKNMSMQDVLENTVFRRHLNEMDFFHLPAGQKQKKAPLSSSKGKPRSGAPRANIGLAFVNIRVRQYRFHFFVDFHGKYWPKGNKKKIEVSLAGLQGREENIAEYEKRAAEKLHADAQDFQQLRGFLPVAPVTDAEDFKLLARGKSLFWIRNRKVAAKQRSRESLALRDKAKRMHALRGSSAFMGLSDLQQDDIIDKMTWRYFGSGAIVCAEGDLAKGMFLLMNGSCTMSVRGKHQDQNQARVVGTLKELDVFGESSLFDSAAKFMITVTTERGGADMLMLPRAVLPSIFSSEVYRAALPELFEASKATLRVSQKQGGGEAEEAEVERKQEPTQAALANMEVRTLPKESSPEKPSPSGEHEESPDGLPRWLSDNGDDECTTLMLNHVPQRLSRDEILKSSAFRPFLGGFDYFHLPHGSPRRYHKSVRPKHIGIAFVNIPHRCNRIAFFKSIHGRNGLCGVQTKREIEVRPARVQGRENLIREYEIRVAKRMNRKPPRVVSPDDVPIINPEDFEKYVLATDTAGSVDKVAVATANTPSGGRGSGGGHRQRRILRPALPRSAKGDSNRSARNILKNDKEVVMVAVAQDGRALRFASDALKNDKEVVMVAVAQDGRALEYASDALKNDEEVVMFAVAQGGRAKNSSTLSSSTFSSSTSSLHKTARRAGKCTADGEMHGRRQTRTGKTRLRKKRMGGAEHGIGIAK
jgi:hypothetical protein